MGAESTNQCGVSKANAYPICYQIREKLSSSPHHSRNTEWAKQDTVVFELLKHVVSSLKISCRYLPASTLSNFSKCARMMYTMPEMWQTREDLFMSVIEITWHFGLYRMLWNWTKLNLPSPSRGAPDNVLVSCCVPWTLKQSKRDINKYVKRSF